MCWGLNKSNQIKSVKIRSPGQHARTIKLNKRIQIYLITQFNSLRFLYPQGTFSDKPSINKNHQSDRVLRLGERQQQVLFDE